MVGPTVARMVLICTPKLPSTSMMRFLLARCSSSSMDTPSSSYFFRRLSTGYLYLVNGSFGLIGVFSTSVLLKVLPVAFSSAVATEMSIPICSEAAAASAACFSCASISALLVRSARWRAMSDIFSFCVPLAIAMVSSLSVSPSVPVASCPSASGSTGVEGMSGVAKVWSGSRFRSMTLAGSSSLYSSFSSSVPAPYAALAYTSSIASVSFLFLPWLVISNFTLFDI